MPRPISHTGIHWAAFQFSFGRCGSRDMTMPSP